ncbi:MAG: complement resistance protein TraT [Arcobacter sp.]|uniref:complement resistance protein TraT n=1 Tax=Arcobacter sp. TaxID=1872629 RepID=UPI003B008A32
MKTLFLSFFIIFILSSCSSKDISKIEITNEIVVSKSENKTISILYNNSTDKKIQLYKKLSSELKKHGYEVVSNEYAREYSLDINTIFANEIGKRSTTKDILSNTNLNITIGQVFGNVGVSGTIGSKIGSILGDSLDTKSYQIIMDITIREFKDNIITNETITQVIAESTLIDESSEITIDILENKIAEKVARIFP